MRNDQRVDVDITDTHRRDAMPAAMTAALGGLDVLVNSEALDSDFP